MKVHISTNFGEKKECHKDLNKSSNGGLCLPSGQTTNPLQAGKIRGGKPTCILTSGPSGGACPPCACLHGECFIPTALSIFI